MNVELAVTRTCCHCSFLEMELKRLGIPYSVRYVEDDPKFQKAHGIKGSPNVLVDDEVIFRGMPAISDLRAYFEKRT